MTTSAAARGLFELASEYAAYERIPVGVDWYRPDLESNLEPTPIIPRAIHAALCPSTSVVLADLKREIVICDSCRLAIENGAA